MDPARRILRIVSLAVCIFMAAAHSAVAETLPVGSHPPAINFPHFPDRVHAVVWRNWQLVPPERIAAVLDTDVANVHDIATSMGLPGDVTVSGRMTDRGYITIIRRNWHLLPYDQLLTLLDMSAEQLAFSLREDDFLFIKLGSLKPKCARVTYENPNEQARRRAAQIKQIVRQHFGDALHTPGEERFAFIDVLSRTSGKDPPEVTGKLSDRPLRYIYSYFGVFGDPLYDARSDPYPDGLLEKLAEQGVSGVWLHVVLRQLAPGGPDFPEFGAGHQQRLENLRQLVNRARRYGIDIYLYMNEPRAQPAKFFENRPQMAGLTVGDHKLMCTSVPRVRQWISDSLTHVFREVPHLGGVFTITASENPTNCAYGGQHRNCPQCAERTDTEILIEVNRTIAEAVHRGNPDARVIIWDWAWRGHGNAREIVAGLPKSVWFMSVSEWELPLNRGGMQQVVGEYSISAVGPGPRALLHWKTAKEAGLKTVAKVQLNVTWEMSSVPFLPVLDLVAQHCANLARADVDGTMMSWSLGGYPSPNLQVAKRFHDNPNSDADQVLTAIAEERYGTAAALHARRAWTAFSSAFEQFPYDGSVLYTAPQQVGPANLLYRNPTGYSASMVGIPYDDLAKWRGGYPPEVFAAQFEKMAEGWSEGLDQMRRVVEQAGPNRRELAEADLGIARAVSCHFASVASQARFVMARDALAASENGSADRDRTVKQILHILSQETDAAKELYKIAKADSRIGYEASNQYFYVPLDLVEKVVNCEHLRAEFDE